MRVTVLTFRQWLLYRGMVATEWQEEGQASCFPNRSNFMDYSEPYSFCNNFQNNPSFPLKKTKHPAFIYCGFTMCLVLS